MPTKSYTKFLKNIETVNRLEDTYHKLRTDRGGRGKAAWDHITRSAIIFLASSFEVYIEDLTVECTAKHIALARDAKNLPHHVNSTINKYVKKDNNGTPPTDLCDEGWRTIYRKISSEKVDKLNTPKLEQVAYLLRDSVGISYDTIRNINRIAELESFMEFRGEIAHRGRADQYVKIEKVVGYKELMKVISKNIDREMLTFFRTQYPGTRTIWYDAY